MSEPVLKINKHLVAASFSKAAQSYDGAAGLQRKVAVDLISRIPEGFAPRRVLDIGCGTGHLSALLRQRFPQAQIVAVDIALGMLQFARANRSDDRVVWMGADAEALPFASESFDLVVSNFALQWCSDFETLFVSISRLLTVKGRILFSLPGVGTLEELKQSWQQVDPQHAHVNQFPQCSQLKMLAQKSFSRVDIKHQESIEYHASLMHLMKSLKAIGAHNVLDGRSRQLTGKQTLRRLESAYEAFRQDQLGLPASWQIILGDFVK